MAGTVFVGALIIVSISSRISGSITVGIHFMALGTEA